MPPTIAPGLLGVTMVGVVVAFTVLDTAVVYALAAVTFTRYKVPGFRPLIVHGEFVQFESVVGEDVP